MQKVLSPVRVYSTRAIPNHRPVEQIVATSPSRRSVRRVEYVSSPERRVEYVSSPVRQVVYDDTYTLRQAPTRIISDQPLTRARSIGTTAGLRKSGYIVRDALPTTTVVGQPVEYIELPASEVRPTYITQRSPEVLYSSESYVPVTYLSAEPVRRVALSPVRSSYIEYVSPGVEIRSSRPGEIRRVGSTIEAPISSYRRALSPVAQSQYHRDISKLFADIKPSATGSQYHTDIAKLFAGIKQPQPRSTYVDDIGKLFSRFGTAQSKIESARIGELFNRTLLSSEFDDRLKFDVDSAVRRIIEKTKI